MEIRRIFFDVGPWKVAMFKDFLTVQNDKRKYFFYGFGQVEITNIEEEQDKED